MRRTILLIILVFLTGLIAVVGVATWKLQSMRATIVSERDGTNTLYRLGRQTHESIQQVELGVGGLFEARTHGDLDTARQHLDTSLGEVAALVAKLAEDRFRPHRAEPVLMPDGTAGEPLQHAVDLLTAGQAELRKAATDVATLAAQRLAVKTKIAGAKSELSKIARKTLALNQVDSKAYNNLMRGIITVMSTESPSDLNFLGKAKAEEGFAAFDQAMLDEAQKAALAELKAQFTATYDLVREQLSSTADSQHFHHVAKTQLEAIDHLVRETERRFDHGQDMLVATTTTTMTTTLAMAGAISVLCLLLGLVVASSLTRPLARTVTRMAAVSGALKQGDLTARVEQAGSDEVSAMAGAINATLDQLRQAMTSIGASVKTLTARSEQLGTISAQLDDASANASAMTTELSTTAQQVSQSIQSVSAGIEEFSSGASEIAKTTGEAAVIGRAAMDQAQSAERTMAELSQASQQIGSIVAVIEAITEQTKLLALNATIEAARAGDAGKGFAVVANEVKVLATKTAGAAGDIRAQADAIRKGATSVSDAITAVAATISKVNDFQQSIAGAVEQQAATTKELARHLGQAATGGAEIAAGVGEVASGAKANRDHARTVLTSAKDLSGTTSELEQFVGRFRY